MKGQLVVTPEGLDGREFTLNWFSENDKIKFEWEEYHCGDTDTEETIEITLGELYNLLSVNRSHEERLKALAGIELASSIEYLRGVCKKLGEENRRLRKVEEEHTSLLKTLDKARKR